MVSHRTFPWFVLRVPQLPAVGIGEPSAWFTVRCFVSLLFPEAEATIPWHVTPLASYTAGCVHSRSLLAESHCRGAQATLGRLHWLAQWGQMETGGSPLLQPGERSCGIGILRNDRQGPQDYGGILGKEGTHLGQQGWGRGRGELVIKVSRMKITCP